MLCHSFPRPRALALALLVSLAGACSNPEPLKLEVVTDVAKAPKSVAWIEGDVDAAFAAAKAQNKPLFVYWGADWCPYCAQLEHDVFTDARFLARTTGFIALHIDGDHIDSLPLRQRFRVGGFPTTQVFAPDGTELGRVPAGTFKADTYVAALDALLVAGRSDRVLFDMATDGEPLSGAEWLALSQSGALGNPALNDDVQTLAETCPPEHAEAARRFKLLVLMTSPENFAKGWSTYGETLRQVLADPQLMREQFLLLLKPKEPVAAAPAEERESLKQQWQQALMTFAADTKMSARARMLALNGALEAAAPVEPALAERSRALVAQVDQEVRLPLERQSAIAAAARSLVLIGDHAAGEALLAAELPTHRAPYYVMGTLAEWAHERGDAVAAAQWARRGYDDAQTSSKFKVRLIETADYLKWLAEKTPEGREEKRDVAIHLLDVAASGAQHITPARVEWLHTQFAPLVAWSQQHDPALLAELQPRVDSFCQTIPEESRDDCPELLEPAG